MPRNFDRIAVIQGPERMTEMTDDSLVQPTPSPADSKGQAALGAKLAILLADLDKLRELEHPDLEPASAWPWEPWESGEAGVDAG